MSYNANFPISFLKQYHLSDSLEYQSDTFDIIYVISGKIAITNSHGERNEYPENNITVLHSSNTYTLVPSENNIMIHFGLRTDFMHQHECQDHEIFCDSVLEPNRNYMQLKNIITNISSQYLDYSNSHELSLLGLIYQLLDLLKTDYAVTTTESSLLNSKYQERITTIRRYLNDNYKQTITLNSLAESMYLTPQYLSKFFKKHFHTNFNQYLNQIRLEHAIRDILYTDKSITEIAVKHGFPNISTFNRHFKDAYNTSPRDYRKNSKTAPPQTAEWLPDNREYTAPIKVDNMNTREVSVFTGYKTSMPNNFTKLMNVGYAKNLETVSFQNRLENAAKDLNLKYIRLEGLISNSMIPRLSSDHDYYFENIQKILDYFWKLRLIPFIELGKNSFDYINYSSGINGSRGYGNSPRFLSMLEAFLKYSLDHFDPSWVALWKFEFWRIPKESTENYIQAYAKINELIKKYIPSARLGGPGHATSLTSDVLIDCLKGYKEAGIVPDFISMHFFVLQYTTDESGHIDLSVAAQSLSLQQAWAISQIREIFGRDIPLYITEFNSSLIPQSYINESCYQAAFICKNMLELHERSELIGYWMLDDNAFRAKDRELFRTNGISLINKNGISLPAYHSYKMLRSLGELLIEKGENYCITQSEEGHYQILTYNYAHLKNFDSLLNKDDHSITDIYSYFEATPSINMSFTLRGLGAGSYRVKRYLLDRAHGSLLDIHLGGFLSSAIDEAEYMYKMQTPGRGDLNYLKSTCIPEERIIFLEVETDLSVMISLAPHNVCLFDIVKEI